VPEAEPEPDAIDVEVIGEGLASAQVAELCRYALASAGIAAGHVAVEFVSSGRIRELNRDHRGTDEATDVLSFPIDFDGPAAGPRELGDVAICREHTDDLRAAVVHGALHLAGMDHESDEGEMLALQAEILSWGRGDG